MKQLQIENRHLSDKVVELKGQIKAMRGDTVYEQSKIGTGATAQGSLKPRQSSKSRDRKWNEYGLYQKRQRQRQSGFE